MKLRTALILCLAIVLLSAIIGLTIVTVSFTREAGPRAAQTRSTEQEIAQSQRNAPGIATPSRLPALVTPTTANTPLPTTTPSPTASPTLAPMLPPALPLTYHPEGRLASAHRAKRDGDYVQAQAELRAILETSDAQGEIAEARYEIAVCAFHEGDYGAAKDLLRQFLQRHPADHRIAAARFYLAETLVRMGEYTSAIEQYRSYLERQTILADLVHTRIGDAYSILGQHDSAAEAYKLALESALDLGQQYDLQEQIGRAYASVGNEREAIRWFTAIAESSKNAYRLARVWYLIGQAHRAAGQEEQALAAFAQAVNGDPRPGYAHLALIVLLEASAEVNEYQRGLINYHAENYDAAVGALRRYIESTPDYDSDAHYYVALSYLDSGAFALAQQESERALSLFPETIPHWGEMWLLKGRALARQDLPDEAVETFRGFAEAHTRHPLAPTALWEAALLLERKGRFKEAGDAFASLADIHVNDDQSPLARFRAGLCRYRSGDTPQALVAWRELINAYPASAESLRARYWLGKTLWTQGEVGEAQTWLRALSEEHPRDYYGMRATHLLANRGRPASWRITSQSVPQAADQEAESREAEVWLSRWLGRGGQPGGASASLLMANNTRVRRGMEMLALGLREEAQAEFDNLRKESSQDPLSLYRLALLTGELGLYAPSLRAAIDLIVLSPEVSALDVPRQIQRLAFPLHFTDLVVSECAEYGLDPLLMFALIRQESVFDDSVVSWAGAVGLAQIMPSTGTWIAQMMPWSGYGEHLLSRPYLNVKFGAWYLHRVLAMTEGDVAAALAGYNGGPANAVSWLRQAGGDPDLFVEIISRDEPQRYVRQVYRHYDMYTRLYGKE